MGAKRAGRHNVTFNCPPEAPAAHTELQLFPRTAPLGRLTQHICRATMELPALPSPPLLSSSSLLFILFSFPFYRAAHGSGGSPKEICLSGPAQLLLTNPRKFFPLRKEANPWPTSCLILLRLLCEHNWAVTQKKEPFLPSVVSGQRSAPTEDDSTWMCKTFQFLENIPKSSEIVKLPMAS